MKKYKLKKDLPTFKAGDEFHLSPRGNLVHTESHVVAYMEHTLKKFPNILSDWFEEIPEDPKTVWNLENGDIYFIIDTLGTIIQFTWRNSDFNKQCRCIGSLFLTKEAAEQELARRSAKQTLLRDTKGFKPDWKNLEQKKYRVAYNATSGKLLTEWQLDGVHSCIHFATIEDAEASIKAHEKEWKIYLGVEG